MLTNEFVHPHKHTPRFDVFCVCMSQNLFFQSVSINSSNAACQLRSVMRYITLSKCIVRPHQHHQLGCYLFKCCKALSLCHCFSRTHIYTHKHKHTPDYMLFFIIHVAFLPLLESVQKKKRKEAMKCEMANVYCNNSVLRKTFIIAINSYSQLSQLTCLNGCWVAFRKICHHMRSDFIVCIVVVQRDEHEFNQF